MKSILLAFFAFFFIAEAADKCCEGNCLTEGTEKYYSIAEGGYPRELNCGECCIRPEDYELYLKFEPNLLSSNSSTPCSDFGYTIYWKTETHGIPTLSVTLDLYKKN